MYHLEINEQQLFQVPPLYFIGIRVAEVVRVSRIKNRGIVNLELRLNNLFLEVGHEEDCDLVTK